MAPTTSFFPTNPAEDDNRIVISGISGAYPASKNVKDFSDILYNKVNPIKSNGNNRWDYKHHELIEHMGSIPGLDRFDFQFFKLSHRMGITMDVMARKLMEQTYQAIYDAGLSPDHLAGKSIGVFIGTCLSDTEKACLFSNTVAGSGLVGCAKSMFANRISYWLDIKGPSFCMDESCCTSVGALEAACLSMARGECEAAIVGAGHVALHPQTLIHFSRLLKLSPDGKTRSFDMKADGCAKSEAIGVLYLQKAKDALRIYADVVHVKNDYSPILDSEPKNDIPFYRNPVQLTAYLKQFYEEAKVSPSEVEYVEAFGAANPVVDKAELEAIDNVFCGYKSNSLLVGSVMSNIGYTEAATGMVSITKVLLGYHKGKIAANLHHETPRQDVSAIREGRVQIATENQPINRSYIAINNFSFNRINSHVLLKGHYKPKYLSQYGSNIPRLVTISGRHKAAVQYIIDDLKSRPIDFEEIALLHNIHEKRISGHLGRGYTILGTNKKNGTRCMSEKAEYYDDSIRPLWFVYSGMGSQWNEMGSQLMSVPVFADTINRCQKVLEPYGVDIIQIITCSDKTAFDNNTFAMIGIVAIQIALTNVLREIGVVPDKVIGHSLGEIGCGYADGCLSLEETILIIYFRARVASEVPVVQGAMAAVGLGATEMRTMCPPEICVACHNGPSSCTLSGPIEAISEFVSELSSKGIFAKMVDSGNKAYHSKYIADMGKPHLEYLKQLIKTPRSRTDRWICTSIPVERWNEHEAKYLTADYYNTNMMNPVLFEEGLKFVPSNAVLIEVAPHGLLQAILKRSLSSDCRHISLTKRMDKDNVAFLLNAIGRIYMEGYNPKIANLYPKVQFPVSTETPLLSHLVQWRHDEKLDLPLYIAGDVMMSPSIKQLVTLHDPEYEYLRGNIIRGKIVYPYAAALIATWDTLALTLGFNKKELSVQFRDIRLFEQPILHEQRQLNITVVLHRGSGLFEVTENFSKIATGYIIGNLEGANQYNLMPHKITQNMEMSSEDIYKLFQERGYNYRDAFRSIHKANISLTVAQLVWNNDWITQLDAMMQLNILKNTRTASQPSYIRRICIDCENHLNELIHVDNQDVMVARIDEILDSTRCGGIMIENMKFYNLPNLNNKSIIFETSKSMPCSSDETVNDIWSGELICLEENAKIKHEVTLRNTIGDLDSLQWVEEPKPVGSGILVKVHYAGINDCDIKRATGIIPLKGGKLSYGMDFSGKTKSGERVMGVVSGGAVSSSVIALPQMLWPVPTSWTLEDAATVPLAYCMAFYCLKIKTQIQEGLKVLILGGAGALGQAAISIALAHGCTVFTTVSDNDKKQLLLEKFPGIAENHIAFSKDDYFGDVILMETNGAGCDVVLSCVPGELRNISLHCCAFSGVTIDTVQIHSKEKYAFGFHFLTEQRSYMPVDFSSIFTYNNVEDMKKLHQLFEDGISQGYVRPLTRTSFEPSDVVAAFKMLQSSRRHGRVLIRMCEPIPDAKARYTCSSEYVHVVISGSQGLQLIDKLISRGARRVRLHCLDVTGYLTYKIRFWRKQGVDLELYNANIDQPEGVEYLLNNGKGPIKGIYIVEDKLKNETIALIDKISRNMCPSLEHFTVAFTRNVKIGIYNSRIANKLPITAVYLPQLAMETDKYDGPVMTWSDAVEAIEHCLISAQTLIRAYAKEQAMPSLFTQITSITDTPIPKNLPRTTTLKSLGLSNNQIQAIGAYLRLYYNSHFENEQIETLTLDKIQELDDSLSWTGFKEVRGLEKFFSYVDPDEVLAHTTIVQMQTRINCMRTDEFDTEHTYLTIIPGVEGHHERFRPLCERLKLPVVVLQPGFATPDQTWKDLAQRYAQALQGRLKLNKSFYILAYESGVPVALEVASLLEANGLTGTVFCAGLTPDELPSYFETHLKSTCMGDKKLEDAIALHMCSLIANDETVIGSLEDDVSAAATWEEKVEICVEKLLDFTEHTAQYIADVVNSAWKTVNKVLYSKFSPQQLNSKIVFLRAESSSKSLNGISKQPVVEYKLDTPLYLLMQDLRCATIIHQNLSSEVLDFFEKYNACEKYIHNKNTFNFIQCPDEVE